ncbi:MAG: ribonuclease E/G, partial [Candidatus Acidiferrales bacterium]
MSKELVISASPHETRVAIVEDGQLCEIYVEREKELALVGSIYKGRVTRVLPGMQSAFVDIGLDSDAFLYVSDFLEELDEYDSVATVEGKVERMEQQGGEVFAEPAAASPAAVIPPDAPPAGDEGAAQAEASESRAMPTAVPRGPQPSAPPPSPPAPRSEDLPGESRSPADPNAPRSDFQRESRFDSRRDDSRRGDSRSFRGERGGDRGERGGDRFGRGGRRDRFSGRRGGRGGRAGGGGRGREFPPSKFSPHRPYEPPDHGEPGEALDPIILPGESLAKYKERPAAAPPEALAPESAGVAETSSVVSEALDIETTEHGDASPGGVEAAMSESAAESPESGVTESPRRESHPQSDEPASAWSALRMRDTSAELAPPPPRAIVQARAAEPIGRQTGEDDLTDEQAANLAEQMAEVEHERSQDEAVLDSMEENGGEENGHESDEDNGAAAEEITEAERATHSHDETDQEIRQNILDAASQEDDSHPAEARPAQARVESDHRARFQRPMRRGGRRRGGRPGGDRHRRPPQHRPQQQRRPQLISELLKAGQEIIVQIAKEPLGKKGARITSHVALPGRYLVYMPTVNHIGVSRKIGSSDKRSRLRHLVHEAKAQFPGGFIVRTAAEGATDEEIRNDVEFLGRTWAEIRQRSEQRRSPAILHRDLNLVERILRDHLSSDYTSIWIDNEDEYTKVLDFVGRFQPQLANRVKLYTKEAHIFEEFGIQQEIDKSLRPKVWLKSGGYIVINHTEALVAIDVNTGKFVGKGYT